MKFKIIFLTLILLTLSGSVMAQSDAYTCEIDFEATVHHGPSAGLSLTGMLKLDVTDGSALGMLTQANGIQIAVVGQVTGRALNLAFDMGNEKYMFGAGTAWNDFSECSGVGGGTLSGPQPGDLGDWGYGIGGITGPRGAG